MRTNLVVIGAFLILLSAIIFAIMIMAEEEVVEKPSTSLEDSWKEKLAEITKDAKGETDPIPSESFSLGLAVILLLTGAYLLYQRNNSNFLKNII
ncbi:MAG: hypothetical protein PHU17_02645 [Candidatus Pacebacteria bacterium]|nr:hypothetical protein [Candidatus Paceibacterota bacterium]MDD4074392.1 hypothetical protein [Candidatus Paceibacterota bacterium]